MLTIIESREELENVLADTYNKPLFLFKHSSTCGVSHIAFYELKKFADFMIESNHPFQFMMVRVHEERELSNEIAERFAVVHMSPQLFLIYKNKATWNTSHGHINMTNMLEAANSVLTEMSSERN
ncbi:hypothetical protein PMSD_13090 [Paenibacillus macquariensis subsp. defensor]|nr:hypothetical protein PMSD_13090 [Paenibacillus macquariensis subsp. defensor]